MDPSGSESTILAAARTGEQIDLGGAEVPAVLLRELLTKTDSLGIHPRGLDLRGAHVTGTLDLESAFLVHPLRLRDCTFDEPIWLRHARAEAIRLSGCVVPGIDATGLRLRGDLHLDHGFTSAGRVRLRGAVIRGDLYAKGGHFINHDGPALTAEGITVEGDVWLSGDENSCFEAVGEVRLVRARIGGLNCAGGSFTNPEGKALNAGGITVNGDMRPVGDSTARFQANGEVTLRGATIHGQPNCRGGRFINPERDALRAEGLTVDRGMFLNDMDRTPFEADGAVWIPGATIGGQLNCWGAKLHNPGGHALNAASATVAGRVIWRPSHAPKGSISFNNARVGSLQDDERTWATSTLKLDGFVYESLYPLGPAAQRLRWLERQDHYSPSSYEQLIATYRADGLKSDARKVAMAKQERHRAELRGLPKLWNWFLGRAVGHGYQPWRAFAGLAVVFLVGWFVFARAFAASAMLLTTYDPHPAFYPAIYTLDVLLPIIDLRQEFWVPDASKPYGIWYLAWFWFSIAAGWTLTTLLVGALTGLLRRD
ncbi:MAG: hypothetical protein ACRDZ4_23920 [Egibacteraceae bacterium]